MAKLLNIVKAAAQPPVDTMAIEEVIDRIVSLNRGIAKFWSKSDGWAPVAAAGLLGKSRLDWQASLSGSLRLWIHEPANALTKAELILAWANLGSLIEGTIKTLLSVWYETCQADIDNLKKANAYDNTKQVAHAAAAALIRRAHRPRRQAAFAPCSSSAASPDGGRQGGAVWSVAGVRDVTEDLRKAELAWAETLTAPPPRVTS
jgi:hypothetical protein